MAYTSISGDAQAAMRTHLLSRMTVGESSLRFWNCCAPDCSAITCVATTNTINSRGDIMCVTHGTSNHGIPIVWTCELCTHPFVLVEAKQLHAYQKITCRGCKINL